MKIPLKRTSIRLAALILLAALLTPAALSCEAPAAPSTPAPQQPVITSPKMSVNPPTITVDTRQGDSSSHKTTVSVANDGQGVMIWAATKTQKWLWLTEANGAIQKSTFSTFDVFVTANELDAGTYTDNITVEGVGTRNSPQYILVTLNVAPPETAAGSSSAVLRKPTPDPPWEYSIYMNSNYHFQLKYPDSYKTRTAVVNGSTFYAAEPGNKVDQDFIMVIVLGTYGVDIQSTVEEWAKDAIRTVTSGRTNLKQISSDNTSTLADGVTPAYEFLYESKSATTTPFQAYAFGFQKGSRWIFFGATAPSVNMPDKLEKFKQIGKTLELLD